MHCDDDDDVISELHAKASIWIYFYIVRVLSILTNPYQALKVVYKTVNNIKKWKLHESESDQIKLDSNNQDKQHLLVSTELPSASSKHREGGVAAELDLAASNWNPSWWKNCPSLHISSIPPGSTCRAEKPPLQLPGPRNCQVTVTVL